MTNKQLNDIAKIYNLKVAKFLEPRSGYRNISYPLLLNNGVTVNFILYKNEPNILSTIKNVNSFTEQLFLKGLSVRHPINSRIVKIKTKYTNERYGVLYNYINGETLPWESYTMKHIKEVGRIMSDLHWVSKDISAEGIPSIVEISLEQLFRMESYFKKIEILNSIKQKLNINDVNFKYVFMKNLIKSTVKVNHSSILHMDLVRGNILFKQQVAEISGLIDFEKVAYGNITFDIARTMAFLMVDCKYKTHDKIYKYFLKSGYNKYGQNNYSHIIINNRLGKFDLLDELIKYYLLYDFYKFLKHNPYEYLNKNHHFVRTKNILIEKGILV